MDSQGQLVTGKHGAATASRFTPFEMTVTGTSHQRTGSLATDAGGSEGYATIYDSTTDLPATFDHGYFWADQACQIQLVTAATNVVMEVDAKVPFSFAGTLLAAASTTNMTDVASLAAIDEITIGNESGSTMNYRLTLID
jgi:hypothetical protein